MPPKREAAIGSREFINPAKFRALLLHPRCVALRELFDLFELWFPLMEGKSTCLVKVWRELTGPVKYPAHVVPGL